MLRVEWGSFLTPCVGPDAAAAAGARAFMRIYPKGL